jgi:hypothetical protein
LIKIYHHEMTETINSSAITICTGRLAPVIKVIRDKSEPIDRLELTGASIMLTPYFRLD